jgi:hypothetical protein
MGLDVWSCERTDTEVYPNIRTKSEKFKEKLLLFLSRSLSDRTLFQPRGLLLRYLDQWLIAYSSHVRLGSKMLVEA